MDKLVHIFGIKGNMGRRYAVILDHLGVEYQGSDINYGSGWEEATAFIIATPTQTHLPILENILAAGVPILVEKPISLNLEQLTSFCKLYQDRLGLITMVDQYSYMPAFKDGEDEELGVTKYDYFKSGGDGLAWDCINIIGKAKDAITLGNQSPIWECQINGAHLNIKDMDHAYVAMVEDWLKNPRSNMDYALAAHKKVEDYITCRPS